MFTIVTTSKLDYHTVGTRPLFGQKLDFSFYSVLANLLCMQSKSFSMLLAYKCPLAAIEIGQ